MHKTALPVRISRLKLNQGLLFWREIGWGTPIVFLHGSWVDGSEWLPILEQMGQQFHCFAPDLLGFGDSERPTTHYSVSLQVEVLAEYLESLRLREVVLVGHEIGGWVGASYALRYPEQVKGLVLLGAEGLQIDALQSRWARARLLSGRLPWLYWLLQLSFPVARLLGKTRSLRHWFELRKTLMRSPAACQMLFGRRRAEIEAELLNSQLGWLKLPTLIVQGTLDQTASRALNQGYSQAPCADVQWIDGADETLMQTHAEAVAQAIQQFVAALSPSL